jgi:hybrid cluster-associated redox disulfide protein
LKKKSKTKVSKDMTFAEIMSIDKKAGYKLAERGMFCGGCPMAMMETLEQGARAHGIDADKLVKELNKK